MKVNLSIGRNLFFSILVLGLAFGLHLGILVFMQFDFSIHDMTTIYAIQLVLGVISTSCLVGFKTRYINQLGFLYMGGSLFKFLVFFVWIKPIFDMDGIRSAVEMGYFFVPYFILLIYDTWFISSVLMRSDSKY